MLEGEVGEGWEVENKIGGKVERKRGLKNVRR